ncbi:hypothetical protein HZS_1647 [Henneguya salminicola]|nr:hypothetical protein HZS_1647 [Henneguya salminicola]
MLKSNSLNTKISECIENSCLDLSLRDLYAPKENQKLGIASKIDTVSQLKDLLGLCRKYWDINNKLFPDCGRKMKNSIFNEIKHIWGASIHSCQHCLF